MAKPSKRQIELSLFYKELFAQHLAPSDKESSLDSPTGLTEDQVSRLSDDLRQPFEDPSQSD
jgi:hypothetical protein